MCAAGFFAGFAGFQTTRCIIQPRLERSISAGSVAEKMRQIATISTLKQLRLSGGEPALGKEHLLRLLELLDGKGYMFILETNGIPLALDKDHASQLSRYKFVHVRVSLKGCNKSEFAMLTGTVPENFNLQLRTLEKLVEWNVSCHPSVMASFSRKENLQELTERLAGISRKLAEDLEIEELIFISSCKRKDTKVWTAILHRTPTQQSPKRTNIIFNS